MDPELAKAATEIVNGTKRLVGAVVKEMDKRSEQERKDEPPLQATGEETYLMFLCTNDPTEHYFTPPLGGVGPFAACPHCGAPLRRAMMKVHEVLRAQS